MNWIIFILIFVSLLRNKKTQKWTREAQTTRSKLKQNLIIALTLSLLFGLGWGVGFAATTSVSYAPVSVTLQVTFILLNSFEGFFIFIMCCVCSEDARSVWKEWIYVITCHTITLDRKTSKFSATSGEARYRHHAPSNDYGTLPASVNPNSNSNTIQKEDIECSMVYANESGMKIIPEGNKKDLALNKDESVIFPQIEESAGFINSEKRVHAVSPLVIDNVHTSPGDEVTLSSASDTLEVMNPTAIINGEKEDEQYLCDSFNIIWVNQDAVAETSVTPTDTATLADHQTTSKSLPAQNIITAEWARHTFQEETKLP
jgi:hypothetical protein